MFPVWPADKLPLTWPSWGHARGGVCIWLQDCPTSSGGDSKQRPFTQAARDTNYIFMERSAPSQCPPFVPWTENQMHCPYCPSLYASVLPIFISFCCRLSGSINPSLAEWGSVQGKGHSHNSTSSSEAWRSSPSLSNTEQVSSDLLARSLLKMCISQVLLVFLLVNWWAKTHLCYTLTAGW